MRFDIRFWPLADCDVRTAYSWYEEQRFGLGRDFLDELDRVLDTLSEFPFSNAEIYGSVRRALLRRFPFGVFYLIVDSEVQVLAVMDLARDPDVWQART